MEGFIFVKISVASLHCRTRIGYSPSPRSCFTFELVITNTGVSRLEVFSPPMETSL